MGKSDGMIVYISGPITGIKNNNASEFYKTEQELKRVFCNLAYLKVVNPIRLGQRVNVYFEEISRILKTKKTPKWEDYMRVCIAELANCTHVVVLKNYKNSKGVKVELFVAKMLGIPVFFNMEKLQKEFAL